MDYAKIFNERLKIKEAYYKLFENISFYPTVTDLSNIFCKSEEIIQKEITELGLKWRYTNLKKKLDRLLYRKIYYDKYYFSNLKYSKEEIADILHIPLKEVYKDLQEIQLRFYSDAFNNSDILKKYSDKYENCNYDLGQFEELNSMKEKFFMVFKTFERIPDERELLSIVGSKCEDLKFVIERLGIVEEYNEFLSRKGLYYRLPFYREYYFNSNKFYTINQMAKLLGISVYKVNQDLIRLNQLFNLKKVRKKDMTQEEKAKVRVVNLNNTSYSFEDRENIYKGLISVYGYVPFLKVIVAETGFKKHIVSDDLALLNLKPIDLTWWGNNIDLKEKTLSHLDVYKKYYFETDTPLNREEIAKILGVCHVTVSKELNYARDVLGYQKKVSMDRKNRIEDEEVFKAQKEVEKSKPIAKRDIKYFSSNEVKLINRANYYRLNYLESFIPLTYEKMADDLGLSFQTVIRGVHKVKSDKTFGIKKLYKNKKGHFINTDFELRNQNYKLYFDKYRSVKNLKELAEKLHLGINIVQKDFSEYNLYEIYDVEQYKNRHKTDNTILKKGTSFISRLGMYEEYFKCNNFVDSICVLSKELNLPKTTVQDDFDKYNLYQVYHIKTIGSNNKFEERYRKYSRYYKKNNKNIESIEKMASDLKIRVLTVYSDFSRNSLYSEFGLKCKSVD